MLNNRDPNSFDREQLFEDVRAAPMVHVGKKHGISGTEVRRVCDALQIPVPAPGHWTRTELGRPVERPALPPVSSRQTVAASTPSIEAQPVCQMQYPGAPPLVRVRRDAGVAIGVAQEPQAHWHPALRGLRQQMEKDAARANRLKKKHDLEQTNPGKRYPPDADAVYGSWEYFCDAGQLLLTTTHRKLVARLSVCSYKRGLSLLNDVCHIAERVCSRNCEKR